MANICDPEGDEVIPYHVELRGRVQNGESHHKRHAEAIAELLSHQIRVRAGHQGDCRGELLRDEPPRGCDGWHSAQEAAMAMRVSGWESR